MARLFLFQDIKKDAATNMMLHRKHLETVEDNIHAHTHIYISMSISVSFFVSMYDYIYIHTHRQNPSGVIKHDNGIMSISPIYR